MIELQNVKDNLSLAPISLNSAAATTTAIDTLGFRYAAVKVILGVVGGAATVCKLTECDTSGGSYTDITGSAQAGSTGNGRLPQTSDAGTVAVTFFVRLGGTRKRYIKPEFTSGATTLVGILVQLGDAVISPDSATERGTGAQVFINS